MVRLWGFEGGLCLGFCDGCFQPFEVACDDYYIGSFGGQLFCNSFAHALRGTGEQNCLYFRSALIMYVKSEAATKALSHETYLALHIELVSPE